MTKIKISLREFIRKPTKFLSQLPIILTQYSKPIARVVSVDTSQSVDTKLSKSVDTSDIPVKSVDTKESKPIIKGGKGGRVRPVPFSGTTSRKNPRGPIMPNTWTAKFGKSSN